MKKFVQVGKAQKDHQVGARDTKLRQSYLETGRNVYAIRTGFIKSVQSEPLNINTRVSVGSYFTPEVLTNVGFPGPSVSTDQTGSLGKTIKGLHGFYEGPVEGKMVSFGYINGNDQNPIVLNSYPYVADTKEGTDSNYISPLTKKKFDPQDVFMSHYVGSYIVIHSKLPIPGTIEIFSKGDILLESQIEVEIIAKTNISLEAKLEINLKATSNINAEATGSVNISGSSINLETTDGHKLTLDSSGLKFEDPMGNEFSISVGEAVFLMNGVESKIGSYGIVSDMDVVGGNASIPIGMLTHKHTNGNLGLPTGPAIP